MSWFGSKNDDTHDEEARRSAKAELLRMLQQAKDQHDRNPTASTRDIILDAHRQLDGL